MDKIISRDDLYVQIAKVLAQVGTCPRAQVGALIVRNGRIISTGYNGSPPGQPHCIDVGCQEKVVPGCTRAIHAEANAIVYAARAGISTDAATMYCTHSMCATCAAIVASAGIVRVVYETPYRLTGGLDLLRDMGVEVVKYG
jgi:dCMP deaminase